MIDNQFANTNLYISAICERCTDGAASSHSVLLAKEHTLTLYVNGHPLQRFVCSPAQLAELCIGWLYDEGYIRSTAEVKKLHISEDGHTADAILTNFYRRAAEPFQDYASIDIALLKKAADTILQSETTHTRTHCTHGRVYATKEGEIVFCEDIGRYNALDKSIGKVLLQNRKLEGGILFSSGRIFNGVVEKTVRARISVLASKAAATEDAIASAKRYGQSLLIFADGESYVTPGIS